MKRTIIGIFVMFVSLVLVAILLMGINFALVITIYNLNPHPVKRDKERINYFEEYKERFEDVNELCLEIASGKECEFLCGGEDLLYKAEDMEEFKTANITDSQKKILNKLQKDLNEEYWFNHISIENQKIYYYDDWNDGENAFRIVYSLDGKKPKYFFNETQDTDYNIYKLGDHWFYMKIYLR